MKTKTTLTFVTFPVMNLLLLISMHIGHAQAPAIEWQKCLGGTANEVGYSIQPTTDGGYIGVGWTYGNPDGDVTFNHGSYDYWVVKTSATGVLQWQKSFGGTNIDWGMCVRQTPDGGYLVLGNSRSSNGDVTLHYGVAVEFDLWVLRLDASGNLLWQKTLGGSGDDHGRNLELTTDGGFIVVGDSRSNNFDVSQNHNGSIDVWVAKLDATGNLQWQRSLGGTGTDRGADIKQTPDGGYILAATTESNNGDVTVNHGNADIWLVKLRATGSTEWQKIYGGSSSEDAGEIKLTADGGYIVGGSSGSNNWEVTGHRGGLDVWIIKTDASGTLLWQKVIGGTGNDGANAIAVTTDGGCIITGHTTSNDGDVTGYNGNTDLWVAKLNATGNLEWQKALGGDASDGGYSILQAADGGYLLAGTVTSTQINEIPGYHGAGDFWLVKFHADNLATTGFKEETVTIYPNPSPSCINLDLPHGIEPENVILIDATGKIILNATHHLSKINIENLSAGMYFLRAIANKKIYLGKFMKQ